MVKAENNLDIVLNAQAGDKTSLNFLSEKIRDRIYPRFRRANMDDSSAEDVIQEVLLTVFVRIKDVRNPQVFWTWVDIVARSKKAQYFRDLIRRRQVYENFTEKQIHQSESTNSAYDEVAKKERREVVSDAVKKLKDEHAEIIYLRHFEHKGYNEIASMTNIKRSNVGVRYHRAKRCLRQLLCAAVI